MADQNNKSLRFLVVDDQFNVRRMVFNFLRTFGYHNVTDAADGEQALAKLETQDIDFIISDWNMPHLNGLGLLKAVRAHALYKDTPLLMVTAEVSEDIVAECVENGVDDYIVKPFQARTLVDKIEAIMARRKKPDHVEQALRQARDFITDGHPEQAVTVLEEALAKTPKSPRMLLALGEAMEAMEKDDQAMSRYQQAADMSSRFLKAHDRMARVYSKMGNADKAAQHLKKAAKISPRNSERQINLGKALLEKGETEEAMEALRKAQEVADKDAKVATEVGEVLLAAGLNDDAAQAFTKAVDINPAMVHVYNRLGIAYRRQKRYDDAIREYQRALEQAPEDEHLYYNMAVAMVEAARVADAKKALQKAIELRPSFNEASVLLKKLGG